MAELIDRRRPARLILGLCMIGLLTLLMGGLMRSFVRGVVLGGLMSAATLALLTLIPTRDGLA